jgi:hypothetical protein
MNHQDANSLVFPPEPSWQDAAISLYLSQYVALDNLAYTEAFDQIYDGIAKLNPVPMPSKAEVHRRLLWLRKTGRLPRLRLNESA